MKPNQSDTDIIDATDLNQEGQTVR
jgi:hypothetical protein